MLRHTSSSGVEGRHPSHHEGRGSLYNLHGQQQPDRSHPQRPYGGSFGSSGGLPQQGNVRPQLDSNDFGAASCLRPTMRASQTHNASTMSARGTAQQMPTDRSHHPPLLACMVPSTAVSSSSKGRGALRRPSMDEEDTASLRTFNKSVVGHKKYNNKKLHIPGASTLSSMGTSLVELATKPRGSNAGKVCSILMFGLQ